MDEVEEEKAEDRAQRLPFVPIYVSDFFGSERVQVMDGLEAGIYALLLFRAFQFGAKGLPTEDAELARLVKLTRAQWARVSVAVKGGFEERDGRLFNARMLREANRAACLKESFAERASKAAQARWSKRQAMPGAMPRAVLEQCHPYPSSDEEPPPSPPSAQAMLEGSADPADLEGGRGPSPLDPPTPQLTPELNVGAFLTSFWGFTADAARRVAALGTTMADLSAWSAAEAELPRRQPSCRNPRAYVKGLMLRHRRPEAAFPWFKGPPAPRAPEAPAARDDAGPPMTEEERVAAVQNFRSRMARRHQSGAAEAAGGSA